MVYGQHKEGQSTCMLAKNWFSLVNSGQTVMSWQLQPLPFSLSDLTQSLLCFLAANFSQFLQMRHWIVFQHKSWKRNKIVLCAAGEKNWRLTGKWHKPVRQGPIWLACSHSWLRGEYSQPTAGRENFDCFSSMSRIFWDFWGWGKSLCNIRKNTSSACRRQNKNFWLKGRWWNTVPRKTKFMGWIWKFYDIVYTYMEDFWPETIQGL